MLKKASLSRQSKCCLVKEGHIKIKSLEKKASCSKLVWEGTEKDTECEKFKLFVENTFQRSFDSDKEFHKWSVDNSKKFWEAVWLYFDIIASQPYKKVFVKTGPGFLDTDWFTEAKFNYAENLLRYRDDKNALIYADEEGHMDTVTFAELFEEVRRYAAAFREHGLTKGDRVACHMSNRKEAVFAMLATLSIGAIWGGSIPYFGPQAAANIISRMEPKFLIAVDRHQDNGMEYDIFNNLPKMVENAKTIEKVIIVPSKKETLLKDISHIRNSCFLHDFLESGKLDDGTLPVLKFEQLPASHSVFLSFTSGTTGIAKATVHSARVLLQSLVIVSFSCDLERGDVIFSNNPVGWAPILNFISCLVVGASIFLYCGSILFTKNAHNIWDWISESKSKYVFFIPSQIDKMEKLNIIPKPSLSFGSLRIIALGGCPTKVQNIDFLKQFLPKDTFVSSVYGATEFFGIASGVYLKSPSYAGENQLPALGLDICCYNDDGVPVVGELGTLVIRSPTPCLASYLWKDTNNTVVNSSYLSRFPGVWCQSDNCLINPKTHGMLVKGRSDDTFIQNGDRFGPGDIYFAIHDLEEIADYICVAQNRDDGDVRVVLFVKMNDINEFTPDLKTKIERKIESELFEDCVPKVILPIPDIPYNMNNKRMESVVRIILASNEVPHIVNIKNPECLKYYCDIPEILDYYKM